MKEIIAIIRPKKVGSTKDALEKLGFPSITAVFAIGRGKQRGIASEVTCDIPMELQGQGKSGGMKYIPKRLISIVVRDPDVDLVVRTIIKVNQTAQIGDGKIFICPVDNAVRVRTDEEGEKAIM
jgi:nitrogen regulatory protein PII 2